MLTLGTADGAADGAADGTADGTAEGTADGTVASTPVTKLAEKKTARADTEHFMFNFFRW